MDRLENKILGDLSQKGYRLTVARRSIVGVLCRAKTPIEGAEILKRLKKCGLRVNRTTVYRELCFLTEEKVVDQVLIGGEKSYEISLGHHHHLVCTKCDAIDEISIEGDLSKEERQIFSRKSFKVTSHSLEFYGLCAKCNN